MEELLLMLLVQKRRVSIRGRQIMVEVSDWESGHSPWLLLGHDTDAF